MRFECKDTLTLLKTQIYFKDSLCPNVSEHGRMFLNLFYNII